MAFALAWQAFAQGPSRPPIVGVANIALKTADLAASREFYGKWLGYEEPFTLGGVTFFKVNDHQYIEVSPTLKSPTEDRLSHIAFETTNVQQLRDYLAAHDVTVPATLTKDSAGNLSVTVKDPDGHDVEFVQYMPGSLHSKSFGTAMPDSRVSKHMIHVGFTVQDPAAANRFYKDILGFRETWHGGMKDDKTDWVDMRVPDGTDWLEYMLNVKDPTPKRLGVMNHLALGVDSVDDGYKTLQAHGAKLNEQPKVGRDGKRQLNMYDKDLTRSELMEFKQVEKACCSEMLQ